MKRLVRDLAMVVVIQLAIAIAVALAVAANPAPRPTILAPVEADIGLPACVSTLADGCVAP